MLKFETFAADVMSNSKERRDVAVQQAMAGAIEFINTLPSTERSTARASSTVIATTVIVTVVWEADEKPTNVDTTAITEETEPVLPKFTLVLEGVSLNEGTAAKAALVSRGAKIGLSGYAGRTKTYTITYRAQQQLH